MKISTKHMSALYNLSSDQFNALEMHSFLNLMNVIHLQLELLQMHIDSGGSIQPLLNQTRELSTLIKKRPHREFLPEKLEKLQNDVMNVIDQLETKYPDESIKTEILEAREIFTDVFNVLNIRIEELNEYIKNPRNWIFYSKDQFLEDFNLFFHAVEKNSRGRYRIVYNIAEQEPTDYLIRFEVKSDLKDKRLAMPIIFKDVIRDLIANARKYTPPGGSIFITLHQKEESLKFIIEDDGVGIPQNELDHVFEFGYRASNVKEKQTMGGGYGLTKALYTTVQFNGDMWLESELDKGTKIAIEVPVPENLFENN